jgi:thiol-disulfide isomerase/thioredoxin
LGLGVLLTGNGLLNRPPPGINGTAWELPQLSGSGSVRVADYRGKPTVANFFATWCTSCFLELPAFAKVSQDLRGRVQFVGVDSVDDGRGQEMADHFGIGWWPLARDIGGQQGSALHDLYRADGMPLTVFYGADGQVLQTANAPFSEELLRARLRDLYRINA